MQVISQKTVLTRKPHRCWGCGRTFPAKTSLEVVVSSDAGAISRTYWCPVCVSVLNGYVSYENEWSEGEVREELPYLWADALEKSLDNGSNV